MAGIKNLWCLDPCRCLGQVAGQRAAMAGWPGRGISAATRPSDLVELVVVHEAHHRLMLVSST